MFMGKNKINDFIEIGPGKVLTGLVKRILPGSNSFSINSIDDIKSLNNES
jgi:malonyl CoA-acyl carrier protein transacylase